MSLKQEANSDPATHLALSVLRWWMDAQYMVSGGGESERNIFDNDPDFIIEARKILSQNGIEDPSIYR